MKTFDYLKVLNSPFKPFSLKLYVGKIALGTPYFFPRRWVKLSEQEATERTNKRIEKMKSAGKNPTDLIFKTLHKQELRSQKAVPKKIGFDIVSLGWKTKWDEYRFEWNPMLSFVFFKWQIAITVVAPETDHYWEAWLYYHYDTDKSLSKKERIELCKKNNKMTWTSHCKGTKVTTDYYTKILKKKYL